MPTLRIGLIGDYSLTVRAHIAIPQALAHAANRLSVEVDPQWLPTDSLDRHAEALLAGFDGLWCVPGSLYASMSGALFAIRFARERGIPFLGTCGGFQHALIEYARNVLGLTDADHAESNPAGSRLVIAPLTCSLVGKTGTIHLLPGSGAAQLYGTTQTVERYHCNFGLNPAYRSALEGHDLKITGVDETGEPRFAELPTHPFFLATLFQPELSSTAKRLHPIIHGFVQAATNLHGDQANPE